MNAGSEALTMIEENIPKFEKTNILKWQVAGYTGKGINIAVYDSQPAIYDFMEEYASIPCDEYIDRDTDKRKLRQDGHCMSVAKVIHEVAPDAKIFLLDGMKDENANNAKWIVDPANGIDLIACSHGSSIGAGKDGENDQRWKTIKASGIPMFCASGNQGTTPPHNPARYGWTIGVGAALSSLDQPDANSNYGEGLDCLAYTLVFMPTSDGRVIPFGGTSCSAPFACGLFALYAQWMKEQKKAITVEAVKRFIMDYAQDMKETGWDETTGYGLISLPEEVPEVEDMKIVLTIDSDIAVVDGREVQMLAAPLVRDGRTYLPVRDVGNLLGCRVDWVGETKQVIITTG